MICCTSTSSCCHFMPPPWACMEKQVLTKGCYIATLSGWSFWAFQPLATVLLWHCSCSNTLLCCNQLKHAKCHANFCEFNALQKLHSKFDCHFSLKVGQTSCWLWQIGKASSLDFVIKHFQMRLCIQLNCSNGSDCISHAQNFLPTNHHCLHDFQKWNGKFFCQTAMPVLLHNFASQSKSIVLFLCTAKCSQPQTEKGLQHLPKSHNSNTGNRVAWKFKNKTGSVHFKKAGKIEKLSVSKSQLSANFFLCALLWKSKVFPRQQQLMWENTWLAELTMQTMY